MRNPPWRTLLLAVAVAVVLIPETLADRETDDSRPFVREFAGRPFRFRLGFECTDTTDGVMVAAVEPTDDSSPFRSHSLAPGNVIVSIGGIPLRKAADLREKVLPTLEPFSTTTIEIVRGGLTIKQALIPTGFIAFHEDDGKEPVVSIDCKVPQSPERKIPSSAAAAQAEGAINVLRKAILDPATGDIEFLGTYDPRFLTGPIPYKDLLKTALSQPKPWLSIKRFHTTEEQQREFAREHYRLMPDSSNAESLFMFQNERANYCIAKLYGLPAAAREQQQLIRLASREYGLIAEEFIRVHNFFHVHSDGTALPGDVVDIVAKALRHTGYGDTAEAWILYGRDASPEAYRTALRRLGHNEGDLPGPLRVQALFALLGSYRQVSKEAWTEAVRTNSNMLNFWPSPLPDRWQSMVSAVHKGTIQTASLVMALELGILPRIAGDTERDLYATSMAGVRIASPAVIGTNSREGHIETNLPRDAQLTRIMYEADFCLKTLDTDENLYGKAHPHSQHLPWEAIGYRMWWEPKQVPLEVTPDRRVAAFGDVEMLVQFEPGEEKPIGPDEAELRWVASRKGNEREVLVSEYYSVVSRELDDFAKTRPAFHELREASKVIALARWIIQSKARIRLDTIEQTRWIPPAFATSPRFGSLHFYCQLAELAPEILSSGGVNLQDQGWASIATDVHEQVPLPQALVQSNDLGQSAVAAAIGGDLEQARGLAELSAQAMLGPLTNAPLQGMKRVGQPQVGQPQVEVRRSVSPSTARAHAELAGLIMREVDGMRAGTVSRQSGTATLERIQRAYRSIAAAPAGGAAIDMRSVAAGHQSMGSPKANPRAGVVSPRLVAVPTVGLARLGSPAGEPGRKSSEDPMFIRLSTPFMISMTEVTQKQFRDVMGTSPWSGRPRVRMGDDFPATWVTWPDAVAFCDKLTVQLRSAGDLPENERFRLPTEAEWEVACRGGSMFAFCYGDDASRLGKYAWFQGNAQEGGEPFAHLVGTKLPNSWGLFDMHGNVLEWCADWYDGSYAGGVNPTGPSTGSRRVCRGGSWGHAASDCRSASRFALPPDERSEFVGFRVVRAARE